MSALQRFENFVERMFEGSFTRLFRSRVQPAEVARRIERVMEGNQTMSVGRTYVPNRYRVALHPEDFAPFEPYRVSLEREMVEFVLGVAQERGWTLVSRPSVVIVSNAETPRHQIDVLGVLSDAPPGPEETLDHASYQPTAAIPIVRPGQGQTAPVAPQQAEPKPAALLFTTGDVAGTGVSLNGALCTIGRELDNDLVIEDGRVSRHHAQVVFQHGRYAVRDLDSTNGTFVNGRRVQAAVLAPGDHISLGGFELQFTI